MTSEFPPYSARVFWSAEDACYVASCPEIDGLSGLGCSREEAVAELSTVLDMAVDTLAAGSEPLPVAAVRPAASGQFRLRVPRSLHVQLVNRAELEGVSLNTLAVTLLAQGIARVESGRTGPRRGRVAAANS